MKLKFVSYILLFGLALCFSACKGKFGKTTSTPSEVKLLLINMVKENQCEPNAPKSSTDTILYTNLKADTAIRLKISHQEELANINQKICVQVNYQNKHTNTDKYWWENNQKFIVINKNGLWTANCVPQNDSLANAECSNS